MSSSSISSMAPASIFSSANFLRNVLRLDALSCVACGLLQVILPAQMAQLLNLPQALLGWTGEFLLVYAALVALISTRKPLPHAAVWLLVAGNAGWALACVVLLLSGMVQPTAPGLAWIVMQAITVAVLAGLQCVGLRRLAPGTNW